MWQGKCLTWQYLSGATLAARADVLPESTVILWKRTCTAYESAVQKKPKRKQEIHQKEYTTIKTEHVWLLDDCTDLL